MKARLAKRILLIGWDAADWQIINPLLEEGAMPALQGLIDRGVSGRIATLQPIISPILWNSIATGKRADKHGILGFVEPTPDGSGVRPVSSTSRRAKAIWNILSQSGLRSSVVGWYASHPAEKINGCILTDRFQTAVDWTNKPVPLDENVVHPASFIETAEALRVHPIQLTPRQLQPFFPNGGPKDSSDRRLHGIVKVVAECASIHNAATYLAEESEWDLLAVYYDAIDHLCHATMPFHPPKMANVSEEDAQIFGYVVRGAYQFSDMMLQRLLQLVGPETTVILLSDHGFYNNDLRPDLPPIARPGEKADRKPQERAGLNPLAWHRPQGIFVAAGPGIKRDELLHGTTLLDITPTILALLGLPIGSDMDGVPLTQILESKEAIEISYIPSWEEPAPNDGVHREVSSEERDPWAARQALEQLAALGYVELSPTGDASRDIAGATEARKSNLAQIYYSTGRYEEAIALLREVIKEAARDVPHVKCRIALCLIAQGRPGEAEPYVSEVVQKHPEMPLAKLLLGQIKAAFGQMKEAFDLFLQVQERDSRLPLLHVQIGQIHLRQGRWKEAETAFRRAIEIDDDCAEAHDGLGVVLRERGALEDAIFEHMRAASLVHHRAQTHVNLGIALAAAKKIDWAIRAFSIATELAPNQPFPHRCLAQLYRRAKKDIPKARAHTLQAWELRNRLRGRKPAFIAGA